MGEEFGWNLGKGLIGFLKSPKLVGIDDEDLLRFGGADHRVEEGLAVGIIDVEDGAVAQALHGDLVHERAGVADQGDGDALGKALEGGGREDFAGGEEFIVAEEDDNPAPGTCGGHRHVDVERDAADEERQN